MEHTFLEGPLWADGQTDKRDMLYGALMWTCPEEYARGLHGLDVFLGV